MTIGSTTICNDNRNTQTDASHSLAASNQKHQQTKLMKQLSQWKSENVLLNTCPHLFLGTSGRYTKSKNKLGNQFYLVNK